MNRLVLWLLFCFQSSFSIQTSWRRRRDLNPRADTLDLLPFQGSPFNHLGTSPCGFFPHTVQINAETGIRTQGGVTLAGFQDRCLKPTRPSLHIQLIMQINYNRARRIRTSACRNQNPVPYRLAITLHYYFHSKGWEMGLEPTTPGTTIQCYYQLSYTHHILFFLCRSLRLT